MNTQLIPGAIEAAKQILKHDLCPNCQEDIKKCAGIITRWCGFDIREAQRKVRELEYRIKNKDKISIYQAKRRERNTECR